MINTVNKSWGYEIWIENNEFYCGKHLHVLPKKYCSFHYHKNKKETFYVINEELLLEYSNNIDFSESKKIILKKGQSFTIDPLVLHRFTSNTNAPCDFIEFSTHHDDNDTYRI